MTPSKKLFLAALLVTAGYGVAVLLGAPNPRLWSDTLAQVGPAISQPPKGASLPLDGSSGPTKVGSVRLLPEPSIESPVRLHGTESMAALTPKSPSPPVLPTPRELETPAAVNELGGQLLTSRPQPRATLKNEAPRPLPMEVQPPPPKSMHQADATAYEMPLTTIQSSANNQVLSAGFSSETTAPPPIYWATNAGPLQPIQAVQPPPLVGPPPWPIEDAEPKRSHVVVDGDSLAKLAGRYLDDPRRSEEIFALNRSVLSDPELLPIGAELTIPPRGGTPAIGHGTQSRTSVGPSIHAATHAGLVPVRLPSTTGMLPRAQLLSPRPVE